MPRLDLELPDLMVPSIAKTLYKLMLTLVDSCNKGADFSIFASFIP